MEDLIRQTNPKSCSNIVLTLNSPFCIFSSPQSERLNFTLVVSLLTVMMAFVNGMYGLTDNSGNPAKVVVLSEGATAGRPTALSPARRVAWANSWGYE